MKGTKFCQLTYGFDKAGMMHTSDGTKINTMDWILSGFQAIWFGDQILSYITSECGWRISACVLEGGRGLKEPAEYELSSLTYLSKGYVSCLNICC